MKTKLKIFTLIALSFGLVVLGACTGGGGDAAKEATSGICKGVEESLHRVCKDGSKAWIDPSNNCHQRCPEDGDFPGTASGTGTGTGTGVSTGTGTGTGT